MELISVKKSELGSGFKILLVTAFQAIAEPCQHAPRNNEITGLVSGKEKTMTTLWITFSYK